MAGGTSVSVTGGAVVGGAVVGGAVVGAVVGGFVTVVVALVAAVVCWVMSGFVAVVATLAGTVVVGVSLSSSSANTKTMSRMTATTIPMTSTITIGRWTRSNQSRPSSSKSSPSYGPPGPPARVCSIAWVGSPPTTGGCPGVPGAPEEPGVVGSSQAIVRVYEPGAARLASVILWALRAVWVTLPVTAGPAAADALGEWSGGPRVAGAIILWAAWGVGLVAALAPRPIGLTALRTIAPAFVAGAIAAVVGADVSALAAIGALAATLAASVLVMHPDVAIASADGEAYGDEQRFPLRTPAPLFFGVLPLARVVAVAGIVTGPLLLADGRAVASGVALAVGFPVAYFALRALHTLSRRWLVLVPAGVVVVDPMTLSDPILFTREHVRALRALDGPAPDGVLDLRLGTTPGSVELVLDQPVEIGRSTRARRGSAMVRSAVLVVTVVRRALLLETAARRRVRVEVR